MRTETFSPRIEVDPPVRQAMKIHRPLALFGFVSLALAAVILPAVFLDERFVAGEPMWLKPFKFILSGGILSLTLGVFLHPLRERVRYVSRCGWIVITVLCVENVLITVQAARGVRSHFNASTLWDGAVYGIMGAAIFVLWIQMIHLAWTLCRHRFADPSWGYALRAAALLAVLGAGVGGLMTRPTTDQMQAVWQDGEISTLGAHSVGTADGGSGTPFLHWNSTHGDLRVAHFVGLHALQLIPLLAWIARHLRRKVPRLRRDTLTRSLVHAYGALFLVLLWQALRGESIARPGSATLAALAVCLGVAVLGMGRSVRPAARRGAS